MWQNKLELFPWQAFSSWSIICGYGPGLKLDCLCSTWIGLSHAYKNKINPKSVNHKHVSLFDLMSVKEGKSSITFKPVLNV